MTAMKCSEDHLRQLIEQWQECVKIEDMVCAVRERTDRAVAYLECIEELEAVMAGNFSAIETWGE